MTDKQHTVSMMAVAMHAAAEYGGINIMFARDALDLYEAVEREIARRDAEAPPSASFPSPETKP